MPRLFVLIIYLLFFFIIANFTYSQKICDVGDTVCRIQRLIYDIDAEKFVNELSSRRPSGALDNPPNIDDPKTGGINMPDLMKSALTEQGLEAIGEARKMELRSKDGENWERTNFHVATTKSMLKGQKGTINLEIMKGFQVPADGQRETQLESIGQSEFKYAAKKGRLVKKPNGKKGWQPVNSGSGWIVEIKYTTKKNVIWE